MSVIWVLLCLFNIMDGNSAERSWYIASFECEARVPNTALTNRLKARNPRTGKLDCVLIPSRVGTASIQSLNCSEEFEIFTRSKKDCEEVLRVLRQGSK